MNPKPLLILLFLILPPTLAEEVTLTLSFTPRSGDLNGEHPFTLYITDQITEQKQEYTCREENKVTFTDQQTATITCSLTDAPSKETGPHKVETLLNGESRTTTYGNTTKCEYVKNSNGCKYTCDKGETDIGKYECGMGKTCCTKETEPLDTPPPSGEETDNPTEELVTGSITCYTSEDFSWLGEASGLSGAIASDGDYLYLYTASSGKDEILRLDTSLDVLERTEIGTSLISMTYGNGEFYAIPKPSGWGDDTNSIYRLDGSLKDSYGGSYEVIEWLGDSSECKRAYGSCKDMFFGIERYASKTYWKFYDIGKGETNTGDYLWHTENNYASELDNSYAAVAVDSLGRLWYLDVDEDNDLTLQSAPESEFEDIKLGDRYEDILPLDMAYFKGHLWIIGKYDGNEKLCKVLINPADFEQSGVGTARAETDDSASECSKCDKAWYAFWDEECSLEKCHSLGECTFDDGDCFSCDDIEYCEDYSVDDCETNSCGLDAKCAVKDDECAEVFKASVEMELISLNDYGRAVLGLRNSIEGLNEDAASEEEFGKCYVVIFPPYEKDSGPTSIHLDADQTEVSTTLLKSGTYHIFYKCRYSGKDVRSTSLDIDTSELSDCKSIIYNGNSKDKLDIMVITYGYDLDFEDHLQRFAKGILSVEPFSEYKDSINFWYKNADSDLECELIETENSAEYKYNDLDCDDDEILEEASGCPHDQILAIVNPDLFDDGLGSDDIVDDIFSHASADIDKDVSTLLYFDYMSAIHELGHTLGELCDEYVYNADYKTSSGIESVVKGHIEAGKLVCANCDENGDCSKWDHFGDNAGCLEGCTVDRFYRPSEECIMGGSSSSDKFCPVCQAQLRKVLANYS